MTNCLILLREKKKLLLQFILMTKHVDPNIRKNQNNFYYDLIKNLEKKSGIYALLNTS